jgi:ABC-type cobalt transport system substrate-binding protein
MPEFFAICSLFPPENGPLKNSQSGGIEYLLSGIGIIGFHIFSYLLGHGCDCFP